VNVAPIMSGPPDEREVWWRYKIQVKRHTHTLIFNRFTRRWWPERPGDQLSLAFTELDLCDDCAHAVLMFAQGVEVP
jgi:hypothetical protein